MAQPLACEARPLRLALVRCPGHGGQVWDGIVGQPPIGQHVVALPVDQELLTFRAFMDEPCGPYHGARRWVACSMP